MRDKLIQIGLSVAMLVLMIQVVLIAPNQIRDAESKAAVVSVTEVQAPNPITGAGAGDGAIDQSMKGMHMIETHEGAKEWELWAEKARSLKAKDLLELEKVKAIFFTDNGVTFTVTGETGKVQVKSKNLRIEGAVVTRSSNGYVFSTERMEYDSGARRLLASDEVEMLGPKDGEGFSIRLTGRGMRALLDQSTMEVLRDVKAEKNLQKGRRVFIKSQRSMFSGKDRGAEFIGDVVLDMDSMRMTGPSARFEWDPGAHALKSVIFNGGARVSDADKFATAQNVRVDFDENRFVFRGNPRVVQNNDELRGEEIIFYDNGKRVQVQRARAKVDERRMEKSN